jgi:hypothetical protein
VADLNKQAMATAASLPVPRVAGFSMRLAPTLPDLFFPILLAAWFGQPAVWQSLLGDGDTGWHIRAGEILLATGRVPARDPFSFWRAGERWYAWEWLSDAIFAELHRWRGLEAVAALAVVVVCLWAVVLFAWLLDRGVGAWISLAVTLAAVSASSVHFLARPHIFSLLLLAPALWTIDRDRRAPDGRLWWLVPLAALWANLHAGFAGWLAILAWLVAASALERNGAAARRYGLLAALSTLATLANPYGWQLHRHILSYLNSPWILDHVEEFQSPHIRSESMLVFAALLLAAVGLGARRWRRTRWFESGLVMMWGFAALRSARHIPWFAVVAAPVVASACADWWRERAEQAPARSALRILWEVSQDLGRRARPTAWLPVLGTLALVAVLPRTGLADFPGARFPVEAVARNVDELTGSHVPPPRVLAPDQWADYLIYRLYPRARVFFDGRSDFYGAAAGEDYRTLLGAGPGWPQVMARYGFSVALLPRDWPLGRILEREPGWRVVYRDAQTVLLERTEL